jgi:hypothetical protein
MSHAFLFVPAADPTEAPSFQKGMRALGDFKAVQITDSATSATASLAVAPAAKATDKRIARSEDGPNAQVWIADLGLWLPLPAEHGRDAAWLLEQYLAHGAEGLARRLQGLFALLIVDQRTRQAHVITDRCGSLHVYWRQLADGVAVCTSSAVLAQCAPSALDPIGVHEFIATGILYEDRSLWQDIRKIGPATVLTLDPAGVQQRRYWDFTAVEPERLNLEEAAEQTHHGLVAVLKALPDTGEPLISDLTGGYDSHVKRHVKRGHRLFIRQRLVHPGRIDIRAIWPSDCAKLDAGLRKKSGMANGAWTPGFPVSRTEAQSTMPLRPSMKVTARR